MAGRFPSSVGRTAVKKLLRASGNTAIVHNDGNKDLWAYADRNGTPKSAVGTTLLLTLGKYF